MIESKGTVTSYMQGSKPDSRLQVTVSFFWVFFLFLIVIIHYRKYADNMQAIKRCRIVLCILNFNFRETNQYTECLIILKFIN